MHIFDTSEVPSMRDMDEGPKSVSLCKIVTASPICQVNTLVNLYLEVKVHGYLAKTES